MNSKANKNKRNINVSFHTGLASTTEPKGKLTNNRACISLLIDALRRLQTAQLAPVSRDGYRVKRSFVYVGRSFPGVPGRASRDDWEWGKSINTTLMHHRHVEEYIISIMVEELSCKEMSH